ncbi:hypothetical protein I5535_18655 [Rhodobacteraceae bacterium F11138]|nr:hypothetical protein [Rhodobacteraceae bacterium F11138]
MTDGSIQQTRLPTRTVVLHIGRHKTGSSSIQATLRHNQAQLLQRGVLVPKNLPPNLSGFFSHVFSRAPEALKFNVERGHGRQQAQKHGNRLLERLAHELEAFTGNRIVLSGEEACALHPDEVAQVRDRLGPVLAPAGQQVDFRVLLYTRDPVAYASSAMQQNIKKNVKLLEDHKPVVLRKAPGWYQRTHAAWAGVFGADAVEFRSFETACAAPGGLIGDFLTAAGIPPEGIEPQRANDSIADEIAGFLSSSHVPKLPPDQRGLWSAGFDLSTADQEILFAIRGSKGGLLTASEQAGLWDAVAADMRFIEREFGITYGAAQTAGAVPFGPVFMDDLKAALPRLSPPVRRGLLAYLRDRSAPGDPGQLQPEGI